ncbi:MAG: hypothetical protein M5U14_12680 [Acidimicrobiia bacterium]|nr:hypothetical protein [Acidimicrobiia bacterium]
MTRRSRFRLRRAEDRLHIVEGLLGAVDRIDAVVKLIRSSADRAAARAGLMGKRFGFSEIQANHILDMPLGRLTRLGREELDEEAEALRRTIRELQRILGSRKALTGVIRDELAEIRGRYATPRRTKIVAESGDIDLDALVEDEPLVVTVTARGYVKATPARSRAAKVADPGDRDALAKVLDTTALADVLFFTDRGRAYRAAGHELPKDRLTAAQNLFAFGEGERVVEVLDARLAAEHEHLVLVTARGSVKRSPFAEYAEAGARRDGVVAMKLAADDRVVAVYPGWGTTSCCSSPRRARPSGSRRRRSAR